MADILIRGMEMPKYCSGCPLQKDNLYTGHPLCMPRLEPIHVNFSTGRDDFCPLVPLPEGHGRLIDADALDSKYSEEINKLEEWAKIHEKEGRLGMYKACHLRSAYLAEAKLNIEAAPIIVPPEGGVGYEQPG